MGLAESRACSPLGDLLVAQLQLRLQVMLWGEEDRRGQTGGDPRTGLVHRGGQWIRTQIPQRKKAAGRPVAYRTLLLRLPPFQGSNVKKPPPSFLLPLYLPGMWMNTLGMLALTWKRSLAPNTPAGAC